MAVKKDKSRQRDVSHAKRETPGRIVLVGTYKGDQLINWPGWYNYPISEGDFSRAEHVERVETIAFDRNNHNAVANPEYGMSSNCASEPAKAKTADKSSAVTLG